MIREIWADNLEEEMAIIRDLVSDYPYVAMDTEFPGVVARPVGNFKSSTDYNYQKLRCNVDLLRIIQLGLTFTDHHGNMPPGVCTWQFNFRFNLNEDMYAADSIEMLTRSGIDFDQHEGRGIDVNDFGELLTTSGIVLDDRVRWITFHSGYDFGYLLKILTCQPLPPDEISFFELVHTYFPCIYDLKYMMKMCKNLKGGLNDLAELLEVERIGPKHQAGSDSLLTSATFFKMKQHYFDNKIDTNKYVGVLYGLLVTPAKNNKNSTDKDKDNNSSNNSNSNGVYSNNYYRDHEQNGHLLLPSSINGTTNTSSVNSFNTLPNGIHPPTTSTPPPPSSSPSIHANGIINTSSSSTLPSTSSGHMSSPHHHHHLHHPHSHHHHSPPPHMHHPHNTGSPILLTSSNTTGLSPIPLSISLPSIVNRQSSPPLMNDDHNNNNNNNNIKQRLPTRHSNGVMTLVTSSPPTSNPHAHIISPLPINNNNNININNINNINNTNINSLATTLQSLAMSNTYFAPGAILHTHAFGNGNPYHFNNHYNHINHHHHGSPAINLASVPPSSVNDNMATVL